MSSPIYGLGRRQSGLLFSIASVALLYGTGVAYSGPCTAQIADFEQQISSLPAGPQTGPTAPQSVGAQLGHQPTPSSVQQGEHAARADADAALERARKEDAAGNADGCNGALVEARRFYGITN